MKSGDQIKQPTPEYLKENSILDLFQSQVSKTPDNLAVVFGNTGLKYSELDQLSNQFANYIISEHKINADHLVGIMLNRSEWVIISILSILKAGASYVPIDVKHPLSRKSYICNDSNCAITIDSSLIEDFILKREKYSDVLSINVNISPDTMAYVIYTSGTTGNPKGVMIQHKSIVNLIISQTQNFNIDETERILLFSNYCFDASVEQIFLALLNGAGLYIIDENELKNHNLNEFIAKNKITHLHATPSYLETLPDLSNLKSLKRIIAGGESCPLKLAERLSKSCDFYNEYGPTETSVTSTMYKYDSSLSNSKTLSIGNPISNTKIYILSENLESCPVGDVGELCISGEGLALGYLNKPELTAKKFVPNPLQPSERIYLTGDYAKWNKDGSLEFIGRKDDQVKIRGYRIELGEVETTLNTLSFVKRAIVIAYNTSGKEKKLAAYIQFLDENYDTLQCREELRELLPDYMIPSIFIKVNGFPMNSNGKVDKKNLPSPEYVRPASAPPFKRPKTKFEKTIATTWSKYLQIPSIGVDDNFFEMGGTSLLTQKVAASLSAHFKLKVPATKIYQYPTIALLSQYLEEDSKKDSLVSNSKSKGSKMSGDIAIIGMAGRFPGASSIEELWTVLKEGKETISFFTPEELDPTIPESLRNDPLYVKARGIVPSAQEFDAKFFGINPKLAQAMDPQQRLFLEIAWEVLEKSGHLPKHYKGSVGVYAGTGNNTYYINNVLPNADLLNAIGRFQLYTVNDKDYIASRTSYHLDLKGPAVSVHSACSTSLLAIAEAVEAIRNGQCEVAIAGGSSVTAPINSGHLYQEGSMLSSDGHCRTFDAEAKGTVFSDGAGVVLLKSLESAIKDGDFIYGLIKGVGINNDGGGKGSFTAPSVEGQADAISRALHDAQVSPSSISYLEAHGTATPLGDPIEMEGLQKAFGVQAQKNYCAIGSIKSNMGHLTAAAGVAGLIKAVLAMNHRQIPPSLGFSKPNPAIDFENSPFYVNDKLNDWQSEGSRRAGISSFGVGGTNVHVVVEEYTMEPISPDLGRPIQLLPWSAKSEDSLHQYSSELANHLNKNDSSVLADVAYSLKMTKDSFRHRQFVVAESGAEAIQKLKNQEKNKSNYSSLQVVPNEIAFLFPGQGAQYLQMGKALYEHEDIFREAVDRCAEILKEAFNFDIRDVIYPKDNTVEAENKLKDTQFTQPALFVIEYALAQLWMHWGIQPTVLCGHSVGEFVAAHLAGIFSLKDALLLVAIRGKLVSGLPGGSMLSVRTSFDNLSQILPESLSLAAVNSDLLCVISGEDKDITDFAEVLEQKEVPNRLLLTSHAFHSNMMNPVLGDFEEEVKKTKLNIPQTPIISTVTGKFLTDSEAIDPLYWTNHLRAAVRFSNAMDTALELEDILFLEVGPGRALTTLSQQKKKAKSATSISSLVFPGENENSYHTVLTALGQLWLKGIEPDWQTFYKKQSRQRVLLPTYVFDRKPCWVNPPLDQVNIKKPAQPIESKNGQSIQPQMNTVSQPNRKETILEKVSEIVLNTSGMELEPSEYDYSFLELGLDSLVLTQMAITCKNEFKIPITFRQLNDEFGTPNLLASYLDENLSPEHFAPVVTTPPVEPSLSNTAPSPSTQINSIHTGGYSDNGSALDLIAQQLQLLGKQLELLKGNNSTPNLTQVPSSKEIKHTISPSAEVRTKEEIEEHKKPFGASPKIDRQSSELNSKQQDFLERLIIRYNKKTAGSKAYTQKHRAHMADPRVVSGFKPLTKELVYPIVVEKSSGNRLWDMDGNEYIDTLNGFGSCLFGHQPDFIKEALHQQVENGFEVGPQHPLAGEVCELLCEFTGHERAGLCNTGSEAVLGAMRIARTVTGRSLIIAFKGSYHGINDEAVVRGSKKMKTFPAAAGILPNTVQNILLLDYGTDESLQIIRDRAHEVAAVLVEPVQSRRPEFQPIEFLKEVREITKASESLLIFDEIITGFRMHLGGTQALFDIKADLATYGKVIGGGISIGAILGYKRYMDALDGGFWKYGDNSIPEVGVTYFAGTFVRHPLALATTKASLLFMKEQGAALQTKLTEMTEGLVFDLNREFIQQQLPIEITYFGSLWRIKFTEEIPYSELLFVLLRENGIHIWDGFPCYITNAYQEEDILRLKTVILSCIAELVSAGFLNNQTSNLAKTQNSKNKISLRELNTPPVNGARLGMDENGNPAWFIANKQKKGEYLKIDL